MTPGEIPGGPATADVRSRLNIALDATTRILREHGRDAYAKLALDQARTRAPILVVVVGETKRGKSALANALMGTPGLSPVGVGETSATFVSMLPLPESSAEAPYAAVLGPGGTRFTIPLSEVAAHADLARLPPGEEPPLAVEIHVARGPLGDAGVIDSPGVGGIGDSRARLTERYAAGSGVLLYLVDAGSPMSRPELDYLLRCAANVEHIVVAVTMIDKYPTTWRGMVEHVRRQLAAASTRLARVQVVGTSSVMADAAFSCHDASTREALEDASGIRTLLHLLSAFAGQRQLIGPLNGLRTCRSGLDNIATHLDLVDRTIGSPDEVARLEREAEQLRARQADLRSVQGRWSLDLDRDLSRLRSEVLRDARVRLETLERDARSRIEKTPIGPNRKDYVRRLTVELVSEYALARDDLLDQLTTRFSEIVKRMFGEADSLAHLSPRVDGSIPGTADINQLAVPLDLLDPMVLTSLSIGASMAERLAMAFPGGPTMSMFSPAGLIGAGAWAAFNIAFRSNRLERAKLTTEVRESLTRQRTEFMEYVDAWIREVKPELAVAVRSHLETQLADLNEALAKGRAAAAVSDRQRADLTAKTENARKGIREAAKVVDDALALGHQ